MKKEYVNNSLVVFEGFYESNLFNSDTEYHLNQLSQDEDNQKTYEITGDNFKNYEKKVCELHADSLEEVISDDNLYNNTNIVKSIKFLSMSSPKYYNFTTDKLHLLVNFNPTKLKKYCFNDNNIDFNIYLKNNFTSYDGFISFIDNNIRDFINTYNTNTDKKDMYIDIMLEYYFIRAIFDNKLYVTIIDKCLDDTITSYKNRVYDRLTELQIQNATVVEKSIA